MAKKFSKAKPFSMRVYDALNGLGNKDVARIFSVLVLNALNVNNTRNTDI